jgi:AcrR family transcriptional regulator
MARTPSLEARQKVLVAAQEVVRDAGIDGFTVDEVAHRSGVAKTTIYRHFHNAHHLVVEALDCMITPMATPNTGSLHEDLVVLFSQHLSLVADTRLRGMVLGLLAASHQDAELHRVLDDMNEQRLTPVRTVLELARARGEIRDDVDLDLAIDLIHGPLFLRTMIRQLPMTSEDLEAVIDLVVSALSVPTAGEQTRA